MNANTLINSCNEMDTEMGKPYEEMGKPYEPMQRKQRRPEPRRKGHGGSTGGGMHCRSNKSHTWGTGAGARLADLRAFAGAVALVVFALLSPASAVEFPWRPVGSIGNAPNTTGLGQVMHNYKISANDTTIDQYAEFLNKSEVGKKGLYDVWSTNIGKNTIAPASPSGISRTGSANNYVYTVVSGFGSKPVNFVSWFSAARFVNWYANGGGDGSATETGSYTLVEGQTSGNIVSRNINAQIFLPSADEWTKAAFYKGGATGEYWLWPTQSNILPVAVLPPTDGQNVANYRAVTDGTPAVVFGMTNVGAYVNTKSTYGLFDMLGNVTQMTDTAGANPTEFQAFGGSFSTLQTSTSSADINSWSSNPTGGQKFRPGGNATAAIGFRVAAIAVPEPGNMVAAAMGIGGLFGLQIMKRRKLALARAAG